jgi:D-sedoheptulose 7-phosphate isomerase
MQAKDYISEYLLQSVDSLNALATDSVGQRIMYQMGSVIADAMQRGGKLLIAGNGGSAGDSQHIAGEFLSRLMYDRPALPAIALTVDSSVITAISNDYNFETIFERQIMALGRPGDVFLAISTSGASKNIIRGLAAARQQGLSTLGFSGQTMSPMHDMCDYILAVPSHVTPIIQQMHIVAAHIICALVELDRFPQQAT